MLSEITIQKLQKTHSSTEQETVCDFFEKDQEEVGTSQYTPTLLKDPETIELETKQQSLASLKEKPEPCYKTKDRDRDKVFRRDVVHETHELLKNPVFVQWWVKRVENSDLGKKLYMPPPVFVKNEIRKKPELALNMWECFQEEITRRVEYFNQRQECGSHIPEYEREEISAIAPYSMVTLQPIRATMASAIEPSLLEFVAQERQKLRMAQTNNRNEPSGRTTANNFPSSRLLTEEEIQARKKQILRHYNAESKSSVLVASDFSTNQSVNSNESG